MKIGGFISYSHADGSDLTKGLAKYLTNLFPNFESVYDENVIEGAKLEEIEEKLRLCNILIVIITPASLTSKSIAKEIQIAKEQKMKIIPCKDVYVGKKWEELPWNLQDYKGIEFENGDELKRKTFSTLVKVLSRLAEELEQSLPKKITAEKSTVTKTDEKIQAQRGFGGIQGFTLETKKDDHIIAVDFYDGVINDILLDRKSLSLVVKINAFKNGILRIVLKPKLINAKKPNGENDNFIILVDGEEVGHKETIGYDDARFLEINVLKDTKEVEIIGTEVEGISYGGTVKVENVVEIVKGSSNPSNSEFLKPKTLKIKQGETVRWVNNDSAAHTITSGNTSSGPDDLFDSSLFLPNVTFEVKLNKKGEYPYFDLGHPWIQGIIVVN